MRPGEHDLDDELRGHLALEIKQRIERGEDPEAARQAALRQFGNVALCSVVRGGLLRPRVNRDEDRLIYIRQTAPGIGGDNLSFSMPEIRDLESQVKTVGAFGDFST